jgi:hypothetical protein
VEGAKTPIYINIIETQEFRFKILIHHHTKKDILWDAFSYGEALISS